MLFAVKLTFLMAMMLMMKRQREKTFIHFLNSGQTKLFVVKLILLVAIMLMMVMLMMMMTMMMVMLMMMMMFMLVETK